ncbi:MAG: hypothetical protein IJ865_01830, partial [Clostridia bacterium]|nr:hypothetical protein [Clostridia bacterium]
MNRTGDVTLPATLHNALDQAMNPATLLRLVRFEMHYLSEVCNQPDLFEDALTRFEESCFDTDLFVPDLVKDMLVTLRTWKPETHLGCYSPRLFHIALRLCWLELLSLYGLHMNTTPVLHLCIEPTAQPSALWEQLHQKTEPACWKVLSHNVTLLNREPLPEPEYVPTKLTPQELLSFLLHRHKVMLSGMGGTGKTELVRQTLPLLASSLHFDAVAFIQCANNILESLSVAFPDLAAKDADHLIDNVVALLENKGTCALLLIDNLETQSSDDPYLHRLLDANVTILATGRMSSLPGLVSLKMPLLQESESLALFQLHAGMQRPDNDIQKVVHYSGGHPMTLALLGSLCRANYWTAGQLLSLLKENQVNHLQFLQEGKTTDLATWLHNLLNISRVTGEEMKLLRLLSLFPPLRPWAPLTVETYGHDLSQNTAISACMVSLADRHWLERSTDGYILHPLIAQALLSDPVSCDEFPNLWHDMASFLQPPVNPDKQEASQLMLYALLVCKDHLNADAFHVLCALEITAMTRSGMLSYDLPTIHQAYLDTHEHTMNDEANMHIIRMLWALLGKDLDFSASAEALLHLPREALITSTYYDTLCNVLEVGGSRLSAEKLNKLFAYIAPDRDDVPKRILYLNFLGGKQRYIDKQPETALQTLEEARSLIDTHLEANSIEETANVTRTAYCLADLGKWRETLPLMRRALNNLRARGYAEDSQTMIATRNAYDYFRGKCTDLHASLASMEKTVSGLREKEQVGNEEYLFALQQLADLYMEDGQEKKAEATIHEALAYRTVLPKGDYVPQLNLILRAARILKENDRYAEALGYITEAELISNKYYGTDAPIYERISNLRKDILQRMGYTIEEPTTE